MGVIIMGQSRPGKYRARGGRLYLEKRLRQIDGEHANPVKYLRMTVREPGFRIRKRGFRKKE